MYQGKNILVVGGTGTIGRVLVKKLLDLSPAAVVVYSRDEDKQHEMQLEFDQAEQLQFIIGDIKDLERLTFAMQGIDAVFHLAAMKHVPTCETNSSEAIKTNVQGLQNIMDAAVKNKVKKVIFSSSDKAALPNNVYGTTKLLGERLFSTTATSRTTSGTIFTTVRLGNVFGSRGSVVPTFVKQLKANASLKLTSSKATRFFMSAHQACKLMMRAYEIATGGEVFIYKMPAFHIATLADVLVEEVEKQISFSQRVEIKEIGVRPGERLHEQIMTEEEALNAWETADMYILPAQNSTPTNYLDLHYWKAEQIFFKSNSHQNLIGSEAIRVWVKQFLNVSGSRSDTKGATFQLLK